MWSNLLQVWSDVWVDPEPGSCEWPQTHEVLQQDWEARHRPHAWSLCMFTCIMCGVCGSPTACGAEWNQYGVVMGGSAAVRNRCPPATT